MRAEAIRKARDLPSSSLHFGCFFFWKKFREKRFLENSDLRSIHLSVSVFSCNIVLFHVDCVEYKKFVSSKSSIAVFDRVRLIDGQLEFYVVQRCMNFFFFLHGRKKEDKIVHSCCFLRETKIVENDTDMQTMKRIRFFKRVKCVTIVQIKTELIN